MSVAWHSFRAGTRRLRRWISRISWIGGVFLGMSAGAHRLDELLQATLVLVDPEWVQLEIRLNPGVAVADAFLKALDRDGEPAFSPEEQAAFARSVWSDIELWLDGQSLVLKPLDQSISSREELQAGTGFVRLRARAPMGRVAAGDHRIVCVNRHRPDLSVYLVNALKPLHPAVVIRSQRRDELQTTFRLAYTLLPSGHPIKTPAGDGPSG